MSYVKPGLIKVLSFDRLRRHHGLVIIGDGAITQSFKSEPHNIPQTEKSLECDINQVVIKV